MKGSKSKQSKPKTPDNSNSTINTVFDFISNFLPKILAIKANNPLNIKLDNPTKEVQGQAKALVKDVKQYIKESGGFDLSSLIQDAYIKIQQQKARETLKNNVHLN